MNQIKPYALWVGHAGEGRDFRQVFDVGIKALVQLAAEELPSQPPRDLIFCRFPLIDGTGNQSELLSLAISTVAQLLQRHLPTLVSCGAGMSRAPAISAAALAVVHRESPEECLERVVRQHPSDVSPGLWTEVTGVLASLW
jgi:protein-tyrosine phosphatase